MLVRCTQAFGYKVPGDTQELPDGSNFDTSYFEEVIEEKEEEKEEEKVAETKTEDTKKVPAKTVEIEKED